MLLLFEAQGHKNANKLSKPCRVAIHWIALNTYSQMSTHKSEFQSFSVFLYHFLLAKLATSSIRVKGIGIKMMARHLAG